jgi:hypothetical protein
MLTPILHHIFAKALTYQEIVESKLHGHQTKLKKELPNYETT